MTDYSMSIYILLTEKTHKWKPALHPQMGGLFTVISTAGLYFSDHL